jgi:hypothetical protein
MKSVIDWRVWMPLSSAAIELHEPPGRIFARVVAGEVRAEQVSKESRRSRWLVMRADIERIKQAGTRDK